MSLDMSKYAPVILLVGVIMVMFMQHPMVKKFGEVIVGFGILFIGMGTMSSAVGTIKDAPLVTSTLGQLSNPFLCVVLWICRDVNPAELIRDGWYSDRIMRTGRCRYSSCIFHDPWL